MTDNERHLKYDSYLETQEKKGATTFSFCAFEVLHFKWRLSIESITKKVGVSILEFDKDGKSLMGTTDHIEDFDHDDWQSVVALSNGNTLAMLW